MAAEAARAACSVAPTAPYMAQSSQGSSSIPVPIGPTAQTAEGPRCCARRRSSTRVQLPTGGRPGGGSSAVRWPASLPRAAAFASCSSQPLWCGPCWARVDLNPRAGGCRRPAAPGAAPWGRRALRLRSLRFRLPPPCSALSRGAGPGWFWASPVSLRWGPGALAPGLPLPFGAVPVRLSSRPPPPLNRRAFRAARVPLRGSLAALLLLSPGSFSPAPPRPAAPAGGSGEREASGHSAAAAARHTGERCLTLSNTCATIVHARPVLLLRGLLRKGYP